ncbi:hypothetical protein MS5380_48440 [Klebsiella pneumoniae]|nr:hypothetical protein Kpn21f22_44310 [Klebsiella pneumoniae]BDT01740.1 hypothetical protein Kpn21rf22_44080 [Klebsiella pneumoniae]GKL93440.1 hypothetical protein NUBL22819_49080 [Klebsiella pneumoniae]GKM98368.1 hypothetical protein MS5232_44090 [Klebsiella pneumoniae]GKN20496.1 hypothetical protein MS5380_48440 [Klebsiella pneumoniae]
MIYAAAIILIMQSVSAWDPLWRLGKTQATRSQMFLEKGAKTETVKKFKPSHYTDSFRHKPKQIYDLGSQMRLVIDGMRQN